MQTIHVSPEFPLNRRMRKAVQRGKLLVVCEGEENSSTGGGDEELEATKSEWNKMREAKDETGRGTLLENSVMDINDKGNAIDYLTMATRALVELRHNPYAWKWALISLHGAIYGFAVCAVKCSNGGRNVFDEKKDRLLSFWDVIKICQDEKWMNRYTIAKPLVLSDEQKKALEYLCNDRNNMAHFPPNLLRGYLPDGNLVIDCLEVVKKIALGTCTVIWTGVDEKKNVAALCEAGIVLARNYILADEE